MSKTESRGRYHGRILFMDDEEAIRDLIGMLLRSHGYEVTLVGDGDGVVTAYNDAISQGPRYDAVVLDLSVPGGNGAKEVIDTLLAVDPGVQAIVSSGHAQDPVMTDPVAYGFAEALLKPYTITVLLAKLEGLIF